ncbi:MAG: hypothetical protein PVG91_11035, partial [Gammaproteobacteria bacterium]
NPRAERSLVRAAGRVRSSHTPYEAMQFDAENALILVALLLPLLGVILGVQWLRREDRRRDKDRHRH